MLYLTILFKNSADVENIDATPAGLEYYLENTPGVYMIIDRFNGDLIKIF